MVGTGELIGGTGSRDPCRTAELIAVVRAVIVAVAAPRCRHAPLVGTSERSRGASAVCRKDNMEMAKCINI